MCFDGETRETKENIYLICPLSRAMQSHKKWASISKTCLFKYIENFTTKNSKFSDKKSGIFHISAQNIDFGHSLELPH